MRYYRPTRFLSILPLLCVLGALSSLASIGRAQAFGGSDNFAGGDSKWAYFFRAPALTVGTNGVLGFNGSTLEFTKSVGRGSYLLGWDWDGNPNNTSALTSASFTTSWVAEITAVNRHQPESGAFSSVGFEVAANSTSYTEITLERSFDGQFRVRTETNSATTGTASVLVPSGTAETRLRLAWNASSRILTVAYSFDRGASFATLRTVPISEWPSVPSSGGFALEVMGYSTSAAAIPAGQMYLDDFSLTTVPADYARLANLSVRNLTADAPRTLIVGFNVDGAGSRPLVIRTVSETLGRQFSVPRVLPDVDLALYGATGANPLLTATALSAGAATAFQRVGAFALDATTTDAALVTSLTPGTYTVHALPAPGLATREGVSLVEVYEDGLYGTRLTNLSARTEIGAEPLIVGFVVTGPGKVRVLLRAVGPSLAAFGLSGLAADPRLSLVAMASGQVIAQNDDWGAAGAAVTAAATAVGAFTLSSPKDAALVVDLDPGSYTVRLENATAASGLVLAELFQIPL